MARTWPAITSSRWPTIGLWFQAGVLVGALYFLQVVEWSVPSASPDHDWPWGNPRGDRAVHLRDRHHAEHGRTWVSRPFPPGDAPGASKRQPAALQCWSPSKGAVGVVRAPGKGIKEVARRNQPERRELDVVDLLPVAPVSNPAVAHRNHLGGDVARWRRWPHRQGRRGTHLPRSAERVDRIVLLC